MSTRAHGARAGGYAHERFKRGRGRFRARIRWIAAACFGPFILAGFVLPFVFPKPIAVWFGGVLLGVGAAAWAILWDSPPAYVEYWRTGAEGERKTAKRLRGLDRSDWLSVHDVDAGRGNYDHIVIGPAGVFLLDTKSPSGTMRVEDGVPCITRRADPEAVQRYPGLLSRTRGAARSLSEELRRRSGHSVWVDPAIVVWCDFPEGICIHDRCTVLHGGRLLGWLESRPARLSPAALEALRAAVAELARDGCRSA